MADPKRIGDVVSARHTPTPSTPDDAQPKADWLARQARHRREMADLIQTDPKRREKHVGDGDPDCPVCSGLGYVRRDVPPDHPQFGRIFDCECRAGELMARLERMSGMTPSELQLTFDTLVGEEVERLAAMAQAFVTTGRGWFTIWGPPGNAKSHLLMAAANLWRQECKTAAVVVKMAHLVEWLRQGYDAQSRADGMWQRFERLRTAPFLAIDEFEKIRETPFAQEIRFDLLDDRYRWGLEGSQRVLTMIAMNCSPDDLPEAIASRMKDGRFIVAFNGQGDARPGMAW